MRNRYYDTTTGQFITEDPIKDGLNWYSYCGGDPVMLVDPSGNGSFFEDGTIYKSKTDTVILGQGLDY